jgi:hypothetical protein
LSVYPLTHICTGVHYALTSDSEIAMDQTEATPPVENKAEYNRAYYLANRDAIRAKRAAHRLQHVEESRLRSKAYRERNAEALKSRRALKAEVHRQKCREYYAANRERIKATTQRWRQENRGRISATAADYRKANGHKTRAYYAATKKERNKWHYEYQRAKADADPQFCAYRKVVVMISKAMQRHRQGRTITNASRIVKLLGCEWLAFIAHIESQFAPGMSWETHGLQGWHFDHIKPLSSFDLTNEDELRKGCHYTNVQPLWAADNIRKAGKIT